MDDETFGMDNWKSIQLYKKKFSVTSVLTNC